MNALLRLPRFCSTIALVAMGTSLATAQSAGFETCPPGQVLDSCAPESWVATPHPVWLIYSPVTVVPFAPLLFEDNKLIPPGLGFPTEGKHWAILDTAYALGGQNSPIGGPAPYPFTPGDTASIVLENVVIQTPITFDYNFVNAEHVGATDSFNDFFTVDIVEPITGISVANLLYLDTWTGVYDSQFAVTPASSGVLPFGAVGFVYELAPRGTSKRVEFDVPPGLIGRTLNLEFHVANALDNTFSSHAWLDNIHIGPPTFPGSWDYRTGALGLNPEDFSCLTQPTSGFGWQSSIDMTPLAGFDSIASIVGIGSNGPTMGGVFGGFELLTVGPYYIHWGVGQHTIPVPPGLTGLPFSSQGVRVEEDSTGKRRLVLLNAVDVVIG